MREYAQPNFPLRCIHRRAVTRSACHLVAAVTWSARDHLIARPRRRRCGYEMINRTVRPLGYMCTAAMLTSFLEIREARGSRIEIREARGSRMLCVHRCNAHLLSDRECGRSLRRLWPRNISMYNQDSILMATEDGLRLRIEPWSWMEMLLTVGPLRDVLGCLSRDLLGCLDVVPTGVGRQRCGRGGVAFKYWH